LAHTSSSKPRRIGVLVDRFADEILDLREPTLFAPQHELREPVGAVGVRSARASSPERRLRELLSRGEFSPEDGPDHVLHRGLSQVGRLPELLGHLVEAIVWAHKPQIADFATSQDA
jgi:hypothetical protein